MNTYSKIFGLVLSILLVLAAGVMLGGNEAESGIKTSTVRSTGTLPMVLNAGGADAGPYVLNDTNTWTAFDDLSITFTLDEASTVMAHFNFAMFSDFSHLVTRMKVDGGVVSKTITGEGAFWSNSNMWSGVLAAGVHTIHMEYRTPKGGQNYPQISDFNDRTLQVMVMGTGNPAGVTVLNAGGPTAASCQLNGNNTWTDLCNQTITFSLSKPTVVMASFRIAMFGNFSALVTRLMVDGDPVSKTITGEGAFWDNSNLWFGELAAGQHTINVQYRTPTMIDSYPDGADLTDRALQVTILGPTN